MKELEVPIAVMSPTLAHLAIYVSLFLPIGSSKLLLVELGDDGKGKDSNTSIGMGNFTFTYGQTYLIKELGNRGLVTNLFGAATNLLRRVDDFGTNIAMAGIKHGVNVAKGTFLVCPLAESGIPTCAIYAL